MPYFFPNGHSNFQSPGIVLIFQKYPYGTVYTNSIKFVACIYPHRLVTLYIPSSTDFWTSQARWTVNKNPILMERTLRNTHRNHRLLVGGPGWTPLKNMTKSIGMIRNPIYGKIKNVPNHQPDDYTSIPHPETVPKLQRWAARKKKIPKYISHIILLVA